MRRYYPSLLVLRGRPKRRPRLRSWDEWAEMVQMRHRARRFERVADRWERSERGRIDDFLIGEANRAQMTIVQQGYRDLTHRVTGIEGREVPGHDAETKLNQSNLVAALDDAVARVERDVAHLKREVAALKGRAVGGDDA